MLQFQFDLQSMNMMDQLAVTIALMRCNWRMPPQKRRKPNQWNLRSTRKKLTRIFPIQFKKRANWHCPQMIINFHSQSRNPERLALGWGGSKLRVYIDHIDGLVQDSGN